MIRQMYEFVIDDLTFSINENYVNGTFELRCDYDLIASRDTNQCISDEHYGFELPQWLVDVVDKKKFNETIDLLSVKNLATTDIQGLLCLIYTPGEATVVARKLRSSLSYYEYSDNFRVADPNNDEQVRRYKEVKSKGCCGFYDDVFTEFGKTFMFGFNYGH